MTRIAAALIASVLMLSALHVPASRTAHEGSGGLPAHTQEPAAVYDAPLLVSGPELALTDDELRNITIEPPRPAPYYYADTAHAANYIDGMPDALGACREHPDRFNWRKYAEKYDWPLDEVAFVINAESRGDLCAVNRTTGAACWFQILSAEQYLPGYLDPEACVLAAYRKWLDGGRSFERHWYRWWR